MDFNKRELELLSDGVLKLIEETSRANDALAAVTNRKQNTDVLEELQTLNSKVCGFMDGKQPDETEQTLKSVLFEEAQAAYYDYKFAKYVFPCDDSEWKERRENFCRYYSILRRAGLDKEYSAWMEEQDKEDRKEVYS